MSGTWVAAVATLELLPGEMRGIEIAGLRVAIFNLSGEYFATSNICTHAFAYLTDGFLDGDMIECPLHAGLFEVRTGKGQGAPITCDLQTFPVRVMDGMVEISVD